MIQFVHEDRKQIIKHNDKHKFSKNMRMMRTFEKWYSFGNETFIDKFPSFDETPSVVIVTVSADDRLLRRLTALDFGVGG